MRGRGRGGCVRANQEGNRRKERAKRGIEMEEIADGVIDKKERSAGWEELDEVERGGGIGFPGEVMKRKK